MSRLCCSDPELFARYSTGELVTDLRLKSSLGTACHSISSVLLQTYSVQLADFASVALTSSSNELVLEDVNPRALELFVHGVYGLSIEQALYPSTDCLTESNIDVCDVKEIWAFGHRYNIGQIELAVCDLITGHLPELDSSETEDVIDFYNSAPTESHALQDAIFRILLGFQDEDSFIIMDYDIKIAPRHVNAMLNHTSTTLNYRPSWMLKTLRLCVKKQELIEGLWDLKLRIPFPPDWKSISTSFDIDYMDEWLVFKNNLRASDFKAGVARWCEQMQCLMYNQVAEERDCYKRHIQATNPRKRIKIAGNQVWLE